MMVTSRGRAAGGRSPAIAPAAEVAPMLSHAEAKVFYDRFGARQDLQIFYEGPALEALLAASAFEGARAVVELGCGTGALAARLLRERLPSRASYLGLDVSETMVRLASERLRPWADRARVVRTGGDPVLPVAGGACDRFLSTYVLDLLDEHDIRAALAEARRALSPGGRLCLASLTFGEGAVSRAVSRLWCGLHALRPALVGGCRPVRLLDHVGSAWGILERRVVCRFGICSEVLVASPR